MQEISFSSPSSLGATDNLSISAKIILNSTNYFVKDYIELFLTKLVSGDINPRMELCLIHCLMKC